MVPDDIIMQSSHSVKSRAVLPVLGLKEDTIELPSN
jgi:hypothetical protein